MILKAKLGPPLDKSSKCVITKSQTVFNEENAVENGGLNILHIDLTPVHQRHA